MTTEQTIQKIITRINKEWQAEAKLAIARLYELMKQGQKVEEAINVIEKEYPKLFDLPALRPALIEAAAYGYGVAPEILTVADEALWAKRLELPWDESGMKLSEKLHGVKKQIHKRIADTVAEQLRKNTSWQDKAKALYDGYTNNGDVIRPQDIAEYMKAVRRATEGDKQALRAQRQALNNIIRLAKNGAPNKALRSAYAKLLQAVQFGTDKQIAKACEVAINEKSRYVAERIIRTEMARAWADGFWNKALNDDDVIAVKFKLSTRHPVFDICDMYAKADMYGLGAGVFPKNKVPALPIHPHCLCRYVELYKGELDMSKKHEQIQQAGDKWLKKLPKEKQMLVLGADGLREWRKGEDWRNYMRGWNGLRKANTRIGLSANSDVFADVKESEFKYLGTTPKEYILDTLKYYEEVFLPLKYENAIIVTKDLRVFYVKGGLANVNINVLGDDLLEGAFMTHNHPKEATRFSFSNYDLAEFLTHKMQVLRCKDYLYEYQVSRKPSTQKANKDIVINEFMDKFYKDVVDMAWRSGIDLDEDGYHEINKLVAKKYDYEYNRRKNSE